MVDQQFMFGPGMLVAPVMHQASNSIYVFLPDIDYYVSAEKHLCCLQGYNTHILDQQIMLDTSMSLSR